MAAPYASQKLVEPFANSAASVSNPNGAAAGSKTYPFPAPSQTGTNPNQASLTDGFPAGSMGPSSTPPYGPDFNGLGYLATANLLPLVAGQLNKFDSTFATAIGGYGLGAVLMDDSTYQLYLNTLANNTTNPSGGGGTGWTLLIDSINLAPYAPLASPALTGTPTVPDTAVGTNTTQAINCESALAQIDYSLYFGIGQSVTYALISATFGVGGAPVTANITLLGGATYAFEANLSAAVGSGVGSVGSAIDVTVGSNSVTPQGNFVQTQIDSSNSLHSTFMNAAAMTLQPVGNSLNNAFNLRGQFSLSGSGEPEVVLAMSTAGGTVSSTIGNITFTRIA